MQLANEVVSNASVNLEGLDAVKKRKHSSNSGAEAENSAVEVGVPHNHSLKIAALEALERNSSHHRKLLLTNLLLLIVQYEVRLGGLTYL